MPRSLFHLNILRGTSFHFIVVDLLHDHLAGEGLVAGPPVGVAGGRDLDLDVVGSLLGALAHGDLAGRPADGERGRAGDLGIGNLSSGCLDIA